MCFIWQDGSEFGRLAIRNESVSAHNPGDIVDGSITHQKTSKLRRFNVNLFEKDKDA